MAHKMERIIGKLEKAGGALTETSILLAEKGQDTIRVNDVVRNINIAVGDVRRALVMMENGEDLELIANKLDQQMEDTFGHGPTV